MARAPLAPVEEVFRDRHLLVLCKPPGLPTTSPDAGDCLVQRARALDPDATALHPLSRLDAMVSGLVAFARTREMNQCALAARRAQRFERCYLALTPAEPTPARGHWSWPLGVDPRDRRLRVALAPGATGAGVRAAHTDYASCAHGAALSLLHLWPRTGRTHQLRVHAARAGHPLLGDTAYGGTRRVTLADGRVLAARRVQLHASWLRLPRPRGEPLELRGEPLADMCALWEAAGGAVDQLRGGPRP